MKPALLAAIAASALLAYSGSPARAQAISPEATIQAIAPDAVGPVIVAGTAAPAAIQARSFDALINSHAASNGIPAELVHRVIARESRYRADAIGHGGASGLMQIRLATARGMGYAGTAAGLLDPDTNLTFGVRYLAGAYRAADGHHGRAVGYYASGYHQAAERQTVNAYAKAPVSAR